MEQIITAFKAKSIFIKSLGRGMFFPWDLYATAHQHDITIDANALADPKRNPKEVIKLAYLCFAKYESVSKDLGLETQPAPMLGVVDAWFATMPDEATIAINYIREQLFQKPVEGEEVKKKSQKSSCEKSKKSWLNQILSKWIGSQWRNSSTGIADSTICGS